MRANGTTRYPAAARRRGPILLAVIGLVAGLIASGMARASVDLMAKVRVQLVASSPGGGKEFEVRDGGVLRTGDGVQLRLEADADAYVYVFAVGSSGAAMLLHPFSERPRDALIRPGQSETIPEPGVFMPLDDREGQETLFIVVSAAPLTGVADVLARMQAANGDVNAAADAVREAFPLARRLAFKHIGARPLVGVAASTPRAPRALAPEEAASPAAGAWTVPGSGGFATSESAPPAAAPKGFSAPASAAAGAAARDAAPRAAVGAASDEPEDAKQVSPALRRAREAAGIDEQQFRGILATLPGSDQAQVPESFRRPTREQGVLSAEGSRIRPLDRVQLESDPTWPRDDDAGRQKLQN